jgi:hypothetical protein
LLPSPESENHTSFCADSGEQVTPVVAGSWAVHPKIANSNGYILVKRYTSESPKPVEPCPVPTHQLDFTDEWPSTSPGLGPSIREWLKDGGFIMPYDNIQSQLDENLFIDIENAGNDSIAKGRNLDVFTPNGKQNQLWMVTPPTLSDMPGAHGGSSRAA